MAEEHDSEMLPVTGLWANKTRNGKETYLGGKSGRLKILVFKNKQKVKGDTKPDYILYVAKAEQKAEQKKAEERDAGSNGDGAEPVPF